MRVWRTGFLLALVACTLSGPLLAATTERVSVSSAGEEGNGASEGLGMSADGRFVAFWSSASDLVAADTNGVGDVFVRDRATGITERVSVSNTGDQGNSDSGGGAMSADGRFVAFRSSASNLVAGDTNGVGDVFVRDRATGITERVSVSNTGDQESDESYCLGMSGDGRYVLLCAAHQDVLSVSYPISVRDRMARTTELVAYAPIYYWWAAAISENGRYVAFSSSDPALTGETDGLSDVFLRDRETGTTKVIARHGTVEYYGDPSVVASDVSEDGRFVAFHTGWNCYGPFVYDQQTGATERVGNGSGVCDCGGDLSADGRFIAFFSLWPLSPGESSGALLRDRQTGIVEKVDVSTDGEDANNPGPFGVLVNADGRYIAFTSCASNLVPGDTNGVPEVCLSGCDVFVRDRLGAPTDPDGPEIPLDPPVGMVRHYLTGQLHAHWMSDSEWLLPLGWDLNPWMLEGMYKLAGYEFIAPTEHHPDPKWTGLAPGMFDDPGIPGIFHLGDSMEDSDGNADDGSCSHILGAAFDWDSMNQTLPGSEDRGARLDNIRYAGGGLAFVAHPDVRKYLWSDQTLMQLWSDQHRYDGIEVFNSAADMVPWMSWGGQSNATDTWTVLLGQGYDVRATAADDFTPNLAASLNRGCVTAVVDLPADASPTKDDIEHALRDGFFYASYCPWGSAGGASYAPQVQGWWWDGEAGRARIRVHSPWGVSEVRFFTNSNRDRGTQVGLAEIPGLPDTWEASLSCNSGHKWVRSEVKDTLGRVSLTQPIWLNPLARKSAQWAALPGAPRGAPAGLGPLTLEIADAALTVSYPQSGISVVTGELVGVADRPAASPPLGYIGQCYSFTPDVPLEGVNSLAITYQPGEAGLCPESSLSVNRYDEGQGQWVALPSAVDPGARTVTASVTHLGLYALSGAIGPDVTPPDVAILTPSAGALISGVQPIEVAATDDNGVSKVGFLLDDIYLGFDTTGADGWNASLDCSLYANGAHTLAVVASDASGNEAEVSIPVVIGDGIAQPQITIAAPSEGAVLWGEVVASGDWLGALPFGSGLIYLGDTMAASAEPVTPAGAAWVTDAQVDLPINGPCVLTAEGVDAAGNHASAALSIVFRSFLDISPLFWARNEIYAAARAGVVQGYRDGTYRPDYAVGRDQMAVYIARALCGGDAHVPSGPAQPTFTDVLADNWAYKYIEYCVANYVVVGYAVDNTYRPGEKVNRGQMAAYVARAIYSPRGLPPDDLPGYVPPLTPSFPDVPTDYPFYKHIEYISGAGVVEGYDDGTYRSTTVVNRGQMAVYVARAFALPM